MIKAQPTHPVKFAFMKVNWRDGKAFYFGQLWELTLRSITRSQSQQSAYKDL